jgi:mannose-6-phosphate isomerase-like protein (cupin superfamily)
MSTSAQPKLETRAVIVPFTEGERLGRTAEREGSILLARKQITITHARYAAGQQVAGPHIHHQHTDAFYVLEGELTFEIGREAKAITVAAGAFVAVPPRVAHSFRTDGDRPARWLTIHARDGGFAAFMRGVRDGVEVEWDISAVPADGGLPADDAIVSHDLPREHGATESQPYRLRCALADLHVTDWCLRGRQPLDLSSRGQGTGIDTFLIVDGAVEATFAGATHAVGPGTLISLPHAVQHALRQRGPGPVRILNLQTPCSGF